MINQGKGFEPSVATKVKSGNRTMETKNKSRGFHNRITKEEKKMAEYLISEGFNKKEAAELLGRTPSSINQALRKGVKKRGYFCF